MPRTARKKDSTAAVVIEAPTNLRPGVIKENHTVVKAWTSEKPIEDEESVHSVESQDEEEEPEERTLEAEDPIEAVISEMSLSPATWSIWVERLPRYEQDGKTDPRSRKYCGSLPFSDPDYLRDERFLEDLQRHFARVNQSNHFICSLKRNGKIRCYLGVRSVEPAPAIDIERSQATGQPVLNPALYQQQTPQADPIKQLKESMKLAAEMRDMLLPPELLRTFTQQGTQQQPPAAAPMNETNAVLALLTTDQSILEKAAQGVRRLIGSDGAGSTGGDSSFWQSLALAAIQQKEIAAGIGGFLAALGVGLGSIMGGNAETVAQQAMPNQAAQPAPPPTPTPEEALLEYVLRSLAEQAPTDLVADSISGYVRRFPQLSPYVDQLLNTEPKILLERLGMSIPDPQARGITTAPGADVWIEQLQDALDSDGEENAVDMQPPPPERVN